MMRYFAASLVLVCLGYVLASGAPLLQQQPTAVIHPASYLSEGPASLLNATSQPINPTNITAPPVTAPLAVTAVDVLGASAARPRGVAPAATVPSINASAVVPVTVLSPASLPATIPGATTASSAASTPAAALHVGLAAPVAGAGPTSTSQTAATAATSVQNISLTPGGSIMMAASAGAAAVHGILRGPMVNQPNPATLSDLAAAAHAAAAANGALAAPGGLHPLGSATVWHSGMGAPPGHSLNAAALNNSQAGASTGASASAAGSAQPLPGGKGGAAQVVPANSSVQVTLLHFNDWHVRVEPTKGTWCGLCTQYDVDKGRCNGGLARMATFVKQQRLLDPDLLLLNAGDDIIGTEWDRKAGVDAPAAFMNLLGPDAMTVGNHEWDKGLPVLKRYIDAMHNNTVLGANIDFRGHELKNKIKPYVIKWVKGRKICIFGLTTMYGLPGKDQMWPVQIKEPYSVGQKVLDQLDKEGCHAKVLLSHLGYTSDLAAVCALPGVDLIVGGHSHAFLWPDPAKPPAFYRSDGQDGCCQKYEHDEIWGAYPTYVSGKEKEVPVFQASWGSRYMGKIVLTFEPESSGGKLSGITSDIALLGGPKSDQHVAQDEEASQLIDDWRSW